MGKNSFIAVMAWSAHNRLTKNHTTDLCLNWRSSSPHLLEKRCEVENRNRKVCSVALSTLFKSTDYSTITQSNFYLLRTVVIHSTRTGTQNLVFSKIRLCATLRKDLAFSLRESRETEWVLTPTPTPK